MRHLILIAAAIAGLAFATDCAFAHAALRHAVPSAGAVLSESPHEVLIEFSSAIVQSSVELKLTRENGQAIGLTEPEVRPAAEPMVRRLIGVRLEPGVYNVFWRVISVDGHRTRGDYSFKVGPD